VFWGTLWNTHQYRAPHNTTWIYFRSLSYALCGKSANNSLCRKTRPLTAEDYLEPSNFFSTAAGLPMGWWGQAFQYQKFLHVVLALHNVRRRKLCEIVMSNRRRKVFCPLPHSSFDWMTAVHCQLCQCILYAGNSPVQFVASECFHVHHKSYLLLPVDCAYLSVLRRHVSLSRPVLQVPSSNLRPGDRLSWLRFFMAFLSSSR
jgi:hypothetical protein